MHGKGRHVVGQQQDLAFVYRLGLWLWHAVGSVALHDRGLQGRRPVSLLLLVLINLNKKAKNGGLNFTLPLFHRPLKIG